MISLEEVIPDPDMVAPEPFSIQRYSGQFVAGGFEPTLVRTINQFGPVRNATSKEVAMLAEADRVSQVRAFFSTAPILTARGTALQPSIHGEIPQGAIPGTTYTLTAQPPADSGQFTVNGLFKAPNVDYWVNGLVLTTAAATPANATLWFQWPIMAPTAVAESDIILYDGEQYRVLDVYRVSGSGYWKCLGTRMATS